MSRKNTIFRVHKQDNYTVIHNSVIKNSNLSWKARGIMAYLLSLPNDWEIRLNDLQKRGKDGRDSVYSGIKELIDHGYIERRQLYDDNNRFNGVEYIVHEQPLTEKPKTEKPNTDSPNTENPTLLNTNNTKYLNNQVLNNNVELKPDPIPYKNIVDYLNTVCGTKYRHTTTKTRDLIKARYNEGFTLDDFKAVIDKKHNEWKNTKWSKYLRPDTLFGTKFEGYLNQKDEVMQDETGKPDNWITSDLSQYDFTKNREVPWMSDDD